MKQIMMKVFRSEQIKSELKIIKNLPRCTAYIVLTHKLKAELKALDKEVEEETKQAQKEWELIVHE